LGDARRVGGGHVRRQVVGGVLVAADGAGVGGLVGLDEAGPGVAQGDEGLVIAPAPGPVLAELGDDGHRGDVGAARGGDLARANAAIAELNRLRDREEQLSEPYWTGEIELQRRSAAAWVAFASGSHQAAIADMAATADAEDRTEKAAVTPGPIAPARELLGDMLLEDHQPARALAAFEATLTKEPNRYRSLAGAMHSAVAAGNTAAARKWASILVRTCAHADASPRPEIVEARRLSGTAGR